ncbi:MAG: imidazole glycerol phosphate synthase subunit HisH [bacterium]
MSLTVINYGGGNIKSVRNMLESLNQEYIVSSKPEDILNSDKLILPGQGHFGQVMQSLKETGLDNAIIQRINEGAKFLGICVGIQILFEESEEAPDIKGLGILKGKVLKFTEGKVPQIGWNMLKTTQNNSYLSDEYVYFVNSYYVKPNDESVVSAYSSYHIDFPASVEYKNVAAFQFHPEKSGEVGYSFIKKWLEN